MRIDKKKASTLFALTLLIVALVAINLNVPAGVAETEELIYLHGPSLQPIHMNSNITLTPVHMHSKQGIINLYDDPVCTDWHELYPNNCTDWHLSSWNDTGEPFEQFSPNDQIDMTDEDENVTWYHVDRITYTLNLSSFPEPTERIFVEFKYHSQVGEDPINNPMCSYWHQVWPNYSNVYHCILWNDNNGNNQVDFCDTIDLQDMNTGGVLTWHVDDVATDLILREKIMDPRSTWWHAIYPEDEYCNWYHITSWESYPDEYCDRLSPCDQIDMTNSSLNWEEMWDVFWSMGDVNEDGYIDDTDSSLIEAHFGTPEQQYDIDENGIVDDVDWTICTGNRGLDIWTHFGIKWYHVDRVTVTLNVTDDIEYPTRWMKIELKTVEFEEMYEVFKHPLGSRWHEVYPDYCNVYNLTEWDLEWDGDDNCNGVLDPCDWIWLLNMTEPQAMPEPWHIEDMTYDLILNEKISDPVCTDWQELYPHYDNWYHIDDWIDTQLEGEVGYGILSPCDNVTMDLEEYHVENVTLTMQVYSEVYGDFYIELNETFEDIYRAKTEPVSTWWYNVYPYFDERYHLSNWTDNCNGVLDHCDNITLEDPQIQWSADFHVEELAIDIVVTKIEGPPPPPPPPPMYWKENYTDYAPSGVPDFNQRQDLWNLTGMWTWCVPAAVANSLWWTDSRFDFHPNGSRLLTNYTAGIDDHDPQNVQPFIQHLAYLMDTDGIRTSPAFGTNVFDMQAGIAQYLSWTGVNPLGDVNGDGIVNQTDWHRVNAVRNASKPFDISADIWPVTLGWPTPGIADNVVNMSDLWLVGNHTGETGMFYEKTVIAPDFDFIEDEVLRSEDVILLLDFRNPDANWQKTTDSLKELGHAVTVAGVNSTSQPPRIAISDPDEDNAEPLPHGNNGPGRVLPQGVTHAHNVTPPHTLHNNASYVSHDIYNVTFTANIMPPPPSHVTNASWALANYPAPLGTVAVVEWAVIVSPLPVEEVCGVNITDIATSHCGTPVDFGYTTWDPPHPLVVNVTVHNNGTIRTNCTVNAYYQNDTTWVQIGTPQVVTGLDPCNTTTLTFNWNLTGLTQNTTYTLKANATCTCGASDTATTTIFIRFDGDVDGNFRVTVMDMLALKIIITLQQTCPQAPNGDVDGNGSVTVMDMLALKIIIVQLG